MRAGVGGLGGGDGVGPLALPKSGQGGRGGRRPWVGSREEEYVSSCVWGGWGVGVEKGQGG